MIHLSRHKVKWEDRVTIKSKRMIIIALIVITGFVLGRLSVRAFMNMLLGGTLFGGNIL